MKAVYDSNIYVSALVFPGGSAEKAPIAVMEGHAQLFVSKPIILEVLDVLARKFAREAEELARVAVFMADLAQPVNPGPRLGILRDEPDNRILECAYACKADVIVTGDKAMLALGNYRSTRIVPLRNFLASLDIALP